MPPKSPKIAPQKSTKGAVTPELFPPTSHGISPYHPRHLLDIFVAPGHFFNTEAALGKPLNLMFAAWLLGLSSILYVAIGDRLLGITKKGVQSNLPPEVLTSWLSLWSVAIGGGIVVGAFLWVLAGWWFRERVLLSGARRPNLRLSRIVYVYASLVRSLPPLVITLIWTLRYPSYGAVPAQEIYIAAALSIVFSCGELISAYIGVKTLFAVDRWKAGIWFVLAPAVWYTVALSL